jgi:ketosteroid isomerase-like protein
MQKNSKAKDIAQRLLEGIGNQCWEAIADLYHKDVVVEWPLAIPNPVLIQGRDNLNKILDQGWAVLKFNICNIHIYETDNPEVVIAEYEYDGFEGNSGRKFHTANILVLTVRKSQIISARGYHNHFVAAAVTGTLEHLVSQILH